MVMKRIEAIVQHSRIDEVRDSLCMIAVQGITVTEVKGFGLQKGQPASYRGAWDEVKFLPKVKIEVVVPDEQVEFAITIITTAARTGEVGDGKIFVSSIEEAVRIRTGEVADAAV
jgi:nitrogen regulatory protein PII